MADRRRSSLGHTLHIREPTIPSLGPNYNLESGVRAPSISATHSSYKSPGYRRRSNYLAVIESPLAHLTDEQLERDVREFQRAFLPSIEADRLLRAVQVAKDIRVYDGVARSENPHAGEALPVNLTAEEKIALRKERDSLPSQPAMLVLVITVSLAAFLQGFVQSSINGASLYAGEFGLSVKLGKNESKLGTDDWKLGAANASPFIFAALVGCWLALPINERVGRRGAMAIAACLIFASSLGSAYCEDWGQLFGARSFNGIGMGIKAVSTPILASESAIGYWRGTSILVWQLWVAFGIMTGFGFNLIFSTASASTTAKLILGAPSVPSIFLLVGLYFCSESPRYYMRQCSAHFDPEKAYSILLKLRGGEFLALRDIYLIHKSIQREEESILHGAESQGFDIPKGFVAHLMTYATQYKQLFTHRRLRNALVSSSTVALAQQLCGINVLAFYSGPLFNNLLTKDKNGELKPMAFSLGFGAINFFFGLPAIRTIDTLGRRKWLVLTLPLMSLFMTAAALSTKISGPEVRDPVVVLFIFLFAAAYSPGLGPIPFTLASESFPLSHREAGCAFAIATNLLFAGILSIIFPSIYNRLSDRGTLGLLAGLNVIALVLVFLLVEETKRRSLEDLDAIFAVSKRRFARYQIVKYIPWFFRRYCLGSSAPRPELYLDLIWGEPGDPAGQQARPGEAMAEVRGGNVRPAHDRSAGATGLFTPGTPFGERPEVGARRASRDGARLC